MDEDRQVSLDRTLEAERALLSRLIVLNQQFHALAGTTASRRQLGHEAREAQDAQLESLAEQGHILYEELLSVHRAYHEAFPRESGRAVGGNGATTNRLPAPCESVP